MRPLFDNIPSERQDSLRQIREKFDLPWDTFTLLCFHDWQDMVDFLRKSPIDEAKPGERLFGPNFNAPEIVVYPVVAHRKGEIIPAEGSRAREIYREYGVWHSANHSEVPVSV